MMGNLRSVPWVCVIIRQVEESAMRDQTNIRSIRRPRVSNCDDHDNLSSPNNLVDVRDPLVVVSEFIAGQTNGLDVALLKLGRELGNGSELGRADRGEVAMRLHSEEEGELC
jgi:hypothetical protein